MGKITKKAQNKSYKLKKKKLKGVEVSCIYYKIFRELDRVGIVDNRPSTN